MHAVHMFTHGAVKTAHIFSRRLGKNDELTIIKNSYKHHHLFQGAVKTVDNRGYIRTVRS
jgi:hypothetical protein